MNYIGSCVQDAWKVSPNVDAQRRPAVGSVPAVCERSAALQSFQPRCSSRRACAALVYKNAPAGVIFEGDPGYPGHAVSKQVPATTSRRACRRLGSEGRRRMTVRAACGIFYDLPHIWNFLGFDRGTPFGTELVVNNGTFDDPWVNTPGGNPFPIVANPEHERSRSTAGS